MKKFKKNLIICGLLSTLLFSDICVYAENEPTAEISTSIELETKAEEITETVETVQKEEASTETETEQETVQKEEASTETETEQETVQKEEASTETEEETEEEIKSEQITYDEYAFFADTYEEAESIADAYNAKLVSFEYGVGVINIPQIKSDSEPKNLRLKAAKNTPQLYPQIYYTVEAETENSLIMSQWHLDAVKTSKAWEYSKGKGVVVAVIDTGIDTDNSDLKPNIYKAATTIPDSVYDEEKLFDPSYKGPKDYFGHGTHVSGIIAAADDNEGCVGIAPQSKILSIKALEKQGKSGKGASSWIVAAINMAIENNADIINMSLGGSISDDELLYQGIKAAVDAGVVVVCAAGNISGQNAKVFYPAAYDEVITVAAVKQEGESVTIDNSYSNFGSFVDISAPGTRIMSDMPGGYGYKTGTSMACPIVAGGIALLLSKAPELSNEEVKELLYNSATDMGDAGWDKYYGHGVIDLQKLMEVYTEEYDSVVPIPEIPDNSVIGMGYALKLTTDIEGAKVVYTVDGTEPNAESSVVPSEGIATESIKELSIKARVLKADGKLGRTVAFHYDIEPLEEDISDKKGSLDKEIIPLYGANIDKNLGVPCKRYNFKISSGETITLQISAEDFIPQLNLYIDEADTLKDLELKKTDKNFKWKNNQQKPVNIVLLASDSNKIQQTKPLSYKLSWKIEKTQTKDENKAEPPSPVITQDPVFITPDTTDDWLYAYDLDEQQETEINISENKKTEQIQVSEQVSEMEASTQENIQTEEQIENQMELQSSEQTKAESELQSDTEIKTEIKETAESMQAAESIQTAESKDTVKERKTGTICKILVLLLIAIIIIIAVVYIHIKKKNKPEE